MRIRIRLQLFIFFRIHPNPRYRTFQFDPDPQLYFQVFLYKDYCSDLKFRPDPILEIILSALIPERSGLGVPNDSHPV